MRKELGRSMLRPYKRKSLAFHKGSGMHAGNGARPVQSVGSDDFEVRDLVRGKGNELRVFDHRLFDDRL